MAYMKKPAGKKMTAKGKEKPKGDAKIAGKEMSFMEKMQAAKKAKKKQI